MAIWKKIVRGEKKRFPGQSKVRGGSPAPLTQSPVQAQAQSPPTQSPPAHRNILEGMMEGRRKKKKKKDKNLANKAKKQKEEERQREAGNMRKAMEKWKKLEVKSKTPNKETRIDKIVEVEVKVSTVEVDFDRVEVGPIGVDDKEIEVEVGDKVTTKEVKNDKPGSGLKDILNKFQEKAEVRDPYEVWKVERSKRKADQMDTLPDSERREVSKLQRRTSSKENPGEKIKFKQLKLFNYSVGGVVGGKVIPGDTKSDGEIVGSSQRAGARAHIVQTSQNSAAGVTGKKTGSGEKSVQ